MARSQNKESAMPDTASSMALHREKGFKWHPSHSRERWMPCGPRRGAISIPYRGWLVSRGFMGGKVRRGAAVRRPARRVVRLNHQTSFFQHL